MNTRDTMFACLYSSLVFAVLMFSSCEACQQSLNVQLAGTDDSQCAYVFSIPVKSNDQCLSLTDAVKYLYNKITLNDHLIAYYPFDEDTFDFSGNNRHGVTVGGSLVYSDGVKSKAAQFNGAKKVVVDAFNSFNFGSQFSVSVWFKRTGSFTTYQGIVNNGYYSTGSWEIRMGREFQGRMIGGGIITADSSVAWDYVNLQASTNDWHHVAMTYDGESLLYYLDGQLQNGDSDCCTGLILQRSTPVTIGQAGIGQNNEFFVGLIDEVKLFNITLSYTDVKYLFEKDSP